MLIAINNFSIFFEVWETCQLVFNKLLLYLWAYVKFFSFDLDARCSDVYDRFISHTKSFRSFWENRCSVDKLFSYSLSLLNCVVESNSVSTFRNGSSVCDVQTAIDIFSICDNSCLVVFKLEYSYLFLVAIETIYTHSANIIMANLFFWFYSHHRYTKV